MKKSVSIISVLNVQPNEMTARLKTIQGLRFRQPKVNKNGFTEVELINCTNKQWQAVMRIW